jgi:hypothetical protein
MADGLEQEAVGVEPEGGVVLAVLGEVAWFVDDLGLLGERPSVRLADDGAALDEERQVLESGPVA